MGGSWNIDNRCLILMLNLKVRKQTRSEARKNNVTIIVFSKALHFVTTLMDNFLVRDRCWPSVTDRSYYSSYYMCIMVHLASIKRTLDWTVGDEGFFFDRRVLYSQLYIVQFRMFVKGSQAYLLLAVWMTILENLPVKNIRNLATFIRILLLNFRNYSRPKIFLFTWSSKYFLLCCMHDLILWYFLV